MTRSLKKSSKPACLCFPVLRRIRFNSPSRHLQGFQMRSASDTRREGSLRSRARDGPEEHDVRSTRVSGIKAVATAAVKNAANGPDFKNAVERECGISLRVLPGIEEARLSALGTLCAIPDADGVMGDIGISEHTEYRAGEKLTLYMPDQIPHPETVGRRLGALAKAIGCDYETIARGEGGTALLGSPAKFM